MRGGLVEKVAIGLAVLFLAVLALLDFTIYRPQVTRLRAAETELRSIQDQLAGVARRNLADQELFLYAGTDIGGASFRDVYTRESGLIYLTRMIGSSGLERLDFTTGPVSRDEMFKVESFSVALRGTYTKCVHFLRTLEGGRRFVRIELIKMQPGGTDVVMTVRTSIYGMLQE